MSDSLFYPIARNQLGGAITVDAFAILSTLGLFSVALRVTWLAIRHYWQKSMGQTQESVFFHTQLGQYAACLIIAMIFNTAAGILGLPWLLYGGINEGWMCRSQALLMQIGNFAAGFFTVSIAVHTFNSLVLRKRQSRLICRTTIGAGWLLAGLIGGAPFLIHLSDGPVYGPDGLLCDVRSIYPKLQFFFHLLPIFLASILSAILYSLIFLALRGTLKLKGGIKLSLNPKERWDNTQGGENYHRFVLRVAKSMLWYPVAYIALLVPYAVMRLFVISGYDVPFPALVVAFACWYSLGVVDVLLLHNTFRVLGPAFDGRTSYTKSTKKGTESFGSAGYLEKYAGSEPQRSPMDEKVDAYRAQGGVVPYNSSSRVSTSSSSANSTRGLLPLNFDSAPLDFSPIGRQSPAMIGRSISPDSPDQMYVAQPLPAMTPTYGGRELIQHGRSPSDSSLPVPPRRLAQSPPSSYVPRQSPTQATSGEQYLARQQSNQTFGGRQTSTRIASWTSEDGVDAYGTEVQHRGMHKPMQSAASGTFGQQVPYPRSPPASAASDRGRWVQNSSPTTSPRAGHRPLMLSSGGSLDQGRGSPSRF